MAWHHENAKLDAYRYGWHEKIVSERTSQDNIVKGRDGLAGENDKQTSLDMVASKRLSPKVISAKVTALCASCQRTGNGRGNGVGTDKNYECRIPIEIIQEMAVVRGLCDQAIGVDDLDLVTGNSYVNRHMDSDNPSWLQLGFKRYCDSRTVGKVSRTVLNGLMSEPGEVEGNIMDAENLVRNGKFPATQIHNRNTDTETSLPKKKETSLVDFFRQKRLKK